MSQFIFVGITFVAAAFRGLTGFGYALIAGLGLIFFPSPTSGVTFILISDLMLTAFLLLDRQQRSIDRTLTPLVLIWGFLGAVVGSVVATRIDDQTAKKLIAVVIFVAACVALIHRPSQWLRHKIFGGGLSFVTGILLAAFATGGPLIAAWILVRCRDRAVITGTLAVFFGVIDLFSLIGRVTVGAYDRDLPSLLALYVLPTVAGFFAGRALVGRLSFEGWHRIASGGLVAIAAVGFAQSVWFFARSSLR